MMTVTVTGRHVDVAAGTRQQIEKKIHRLERLLNDNAVSAQCVVTQERLRVHCELTVHVRGDHQLVGVGSHQHLSTAVGLAIEKVKQQAQRLADRWKTQKRVVRGPRALPVEDVAAVPVAPEPRRRVIRSRAYAVKPMTVDDAVVLIDAGSQPVVVFRDAETESVTVLYRRADGHLGVIDTES
jgi:putative sigma-54 modulation protein